MPSTDPTTKLAAVATALQTTFATLTDLTRVYEYDPHGAPIKPPVVTIGLPSVDRHRIDEAKLELGHDDWLTTWPVTLYISLEDPKTSTLNHHRIVGELIRAIERDPTLGGEADVAELITATPDENNIAADTRQYIVHLRVEVRVLLPLPFP